MENLNTLLTSAGMTALHWTRIALPIDISFFSFQKLTYAVDVYRKVHRPLKRVTDYAMYILMFPQLIAGPIVRFNEIADQIEDRKANENPENRLTGMFRFMIGLAKKVLIANVLGKQVDLIFSMDPSQITMGLSWIGIVAYAFQSVGCPTRHRGVDRTALRKEAAATNPYADGLFLPPSLSPKPCSHYKLRF